MSWNSSQRQGRFGFFVKLFLGLVLLFGTFASANIKQNVRVEHTPVFEKSSATSKVVEYLKKGIELHTSGSPTRGFYKVFTPEHRIGWVRTEAIDFTEDRPSSPPSRITVPAIWDEARAAFRNSFWIEVGSSGSFPNPVGGGSFRLGYLFNNFGIDFQGKMVTSAWGSIGSDPDSELVSTGFSSVSISRSSSDPWQYTLFGPGVILAGTFLDTLPLLTEKARVGFWGGSFVDQKNAINLSAALISFEAALQYRLGITSRFAVELAMAYQFGKLADSAVGRALGETEVPVSYLSSGLSLLFWF